MTRVIDRIRSGKTRYVMLTIYEVETIISILKEAWSKRYTDRDYIISIFNIEETEEIEIGNYFFTIIGEAIDELSYLVEKAKKENGKIVYHWDY